MGWEQRGKGVYLYKKVRDGDRVRSVYVSGEAFFQAMDQVLEEDRKAKKERARLEEQKEREEIEATERSIREIDRQIREELSAALTASGYHHHKGQWRKRRGKR